MCCLVFVLLHVRIDSRGDWYRGCLWCFIGIAASSNILILPIYFPPLSCSFSDIAWNHVASREFGELVSPDACLELAIYDRDKVSKDEQIGRLVTYWGSTL